MKIKHVVEVVWKLYYDGRPKATAQTISKGDFTQACLLAYAGITRQKFLESKGRDESGEADYSFTSQMLSIKKFVLSEANGVGMRRADMDEYDLFRLPKNANFTNVYPLGSDCSGQNVGNVTQVSAGEENFYLTADFSDFKFFVVNGRGINTYHIPPCVKEVEIETTYIVDDVDLSMDLAYEVLMAVLGLTIKINGIPIKIQDNVYAPQPTELKHRLQQEAQNSQS